MKITTMSFFKIFLIFLLTVNLSCSSEYDSLVKSELKKNQKVDSLFFNLRLGEAKDIYHAKSWDLNNSKKVVQGDRFVIDNPSASTTCGCGSSFSI